MGEVTKFVRDYTVGSPKRSRLSHAVGRPFWIGAMIGLVGGVYFLHSVWDDVGALWGITMVLVAVFCGVLLQALTDLVRGVRAREVNRKYFYSLAGIIAVAVVYGMVYYYLTPEFGVLKLFAGGTLVVISAIFGYLLGKAERR